MLTQRIINLLSQCNSYLTLGQLASQLCASQSAVSKAVEDIRQYGLALLASAPGRAGIGGYCVVSSVQDPKYQRMLRWNERWRRSNRISPPVSPVL